MNTVAGTTSRKLLRTAGWTAVPLLLVIAWQIAAMHLAQPWLLPSPAKVVVRLMRPFGDLYSSGSLFSNTLVSLIRVTVGFTLAAVVGTVIGLLLGTTPSLRALTEPTIEIIRPLCPIAWLPFAIAVFKMKTLPQLFGFGYTHTVFDQVQAGMVFVLFWGGFFPILVNTLDGVSTVRRNYVLLAEMLGATRRQMFFKVFIPAALPSIMTGLRQGISTCWFVIIAAEMLPGAQNGIGYLLIYSADQAGMDVVVACMLIIGILGALLNFTMTRAMCVFTHWKEKEN